MKTQLIIAIKIFAILTVLCGVIYPLVITGIAQSAFPGKANGSLIVVEHTIAGSELIGQKFDSPGYFSSRPSAVDYNPLPSGGSNLGPSSEKLKELVQEHEMQFRKANELSDSVKVPSEMLFASGSGLDPHISPHAALLQIERIASVRSLTNRKKQQLVKLVDDLTETSKFFLPGEPRINVLKLNLALNNLIESKNN